MLPERIDVINIDELLKHVNIEARGFHPDKATGISSVATTPMSREIR